MTYHELIYNCMYWQVIIAPVYIVTTFARFICTTILHLSGVDEIDSSLIQMKFALNHPYVFKNY